MSTVLHDRLRQLGNKPRFHGNGFAQLYLNDRQRLHVWDPTLAPLSDHNATIHDHIFDMKSTVLLGTIVHKVYDEGTFAGDHVGFDRYRVDRELDRLVLDRELVLYGLVGVYRMNVGSNYYFPHRRMHDTDWTGGHAATLMEKTKVWDLEPWVLCPVGERPKNAFDLDPAHAARNEKALWDVIDRAVENLSLASHDLLEAAIPA